MLELGLRVVFSLALVVGLVWLIARVSSRRLRGSAGATLRTVVRQPLGRNASMAVVTVGQRVLVVGVTEHQISLLTELDPDELEATEHLLAERTTDPSASDPTASVPTAIGGGLRPVPQVLPQPAAARSGAHRGEPTPALTALSGLSGSVLSPHTWKQALAAVSGRSEAAS